MKLNNRRYVLIGIITYAIFLLLLLPAKQTLRLLHQDQANIQLGNITGTIWAGKIDQIIINKLILNQISWDFSVLTLLTGSAAIDISFTTQGEQATARLSIDYAGQREISKLHAVIAAQDIATMSGLGYLALTGAMTINLENATFNDNLIEMVTGEITWKGAGFTLLKKTYPLGELKLSLTTDNDTVSGTLTDVNSPLSLHGRVKITDDNYQFEGEVTSKDNSAKFNQLLGMLGRKDSSGRYHFKRNGKVPL